MNIPIWNPLILESLIQICLKETTKFYSDIIQWFRSIEGHTKISMSLKLNAPKHKAPPVGK